MRPEVLSQVMVSSRYRLRPRPPLQKWVDERASKWQQAKGGFKWLGAVLLMQLVSTYTNYLGMSTAMPNIAAVVFAIGLQAAALYAGLSLLHATGATRQAWKLPLAAILFASVYFSYAGFIKFYTDYQDKGTVALEARDDLKDQSVELSQSIAEAKTLALAKFQNRIAYARNENSRIRSKQARGLYPDADAAEAQIAENDSRIRQAEEAEQRWRDFRFDAEGAIGAPTVEHGFSRLQDAYNTLGELVGLMTKSELGEFQMPGSPALKRRAITDAPKVDHIDFALRRLFSWSGLFWFTLAALMEAIPFMMAHARSFNHEAPADESSNPEIGPGSDDPDRIAPRTTRDAAYAEEITDFNARARLSAFVGANTPGEIIEQETRLQPVVDEMRKAHVEALWLETIAKTQELRRAQLEMLMAEADARGVPEAEKQRVVEDDWREVLKDFGIEQARLETLRDSRRSGLMRPAEEI